MFERYTEKARRVIFFAHYEASQFGSSNIETEHLLLGVLREDKALTSRFLRGHAAVDTIRKEIEAATGERKPVPTSVDLPLSNEGKRVLAYAAEEAERLSHRHIGTAHLFLGLLREEGTFAARLLGTRGVTLEAARGHCEKLSEPTAAAAAQQAASSPIGVELTKQASEGLLPAMVGRAQEMERLTHVLGRRTKSNAVLVGELGVGKRAIVEGLAERMARNDVPEFLHGKMIVELDLSAFVKRPPDPADLESPDTIFFIEDLHSRLAVEQETGDLAKALILANESRAVDPVRSALLKGSFQCICCATPEQHRKAIEHYPWVERSFVPIEVRPATEPETIEILLSAKNRLERFHSVTYTDEAVRSAAHYAGVYVHNRHLPEKALDLLDEAGVYVKLRHVNLPDEIVEVRKRIKFIVHRIELSVANEELEKARFYSEEGRQESEKLKELNTKYGILEEGVMSVTREDVEEALARSTGIPVDKIRQTPPGAGPETPGK